MSTSTESDRPLLPPLDSGAGPAKRISPARADAIVAATLREHGLGARGVRRRVWRPWWQAAAAILLFFGVAGAVTAGYHFTRREPARGLLESSPREAPGRPAGEARGVLPPAPEPPAPEPVPTRPAETGPQPPSAQVDTPQPRAPEDLLEVANGLRARRRWQAAERAYVRVLREHPASGQTYPASIAAATLRLEHLGNAPGALRLFRRALASRPHGPLALEARQGIADCYRSLGNGAAEAEALRALLAAHPGSALVPRAQARLRELSGTTP